MKKVPLLTNLMKHILLLLMSIAMLFSGPAGALAETAGSEAEETVQEAGWLPVLNDGSPWVDYSLRENIALAEEKPASPKDDFYLWVNYDWLRSAEIAPGDFSADGFTWMAKDISKMCLDVLTDPTLQSRDAAMAQHLYSAYLDWDARNALGVAPLQEIISGIAAVSTLDELTQLMADPDYAGRDLFTFDIIPGLNDPDTWITSIRPMSLLLVDSAEYRERTEQGNRYEAAFRESIGKMLEKLGYSREEASEMMTRFFALETELADSIMTSAEEMSPDYAQRINTELSRDEAKKLCSAFPWLEIMDARGFAGAQRFLVEQPAYLRKFDEIYREDRLEDLKNCLIIRTVGYHMDDLDQEADGFYTLLYNRIYGVEGSQSDEEKAREAVCMMLPVQMNNAFFEKFDPTKMKSDITRLCEEAVAYYRRMLSEEEWLTEETRAKAIEKLDALKIIAVCPEKRPDYSGLTLDGLGYFDCIQAVNRYHTALNASLADQPVDPDLWYCTGVGFWANNVLEANAVYMPSTNTFFIMRGILGDVFYREDMSEEELYGAIGIIIAHEISHAFDANGAQYDAGGRLSNWWTEEDSAAFSARSQKLIEYYDGIIAFDGVHVSGQSVQGEAIADMGGVKCMLSLLEQKKGTVDYRTFFESFARCWRGICSWEIEYYQLLQDPHPLSEIRTNSVVQQFPQFHEAYGITEGDGMYLSPADRVLVW